MKRFKKILLPFLAITCTMMLLSFNIEEKVKNWFLAGSSPSDYEIGITLDKERGSKVAFLKSTQKKIKGFGTIMQSFDSKKFNGKKVKLTAYIKSNEVDGWAGMWMRVDQEGKRAVSFDNMQDRPIKGTSRWKKYEIILDVPTESKSISYGVLLSGVGEIFLDNLKFEIVNTAEEKTGRTKLDAPANTNFED